MFTAKKVYAMLENESLWQTATQCHRMLAAMRGTYKDFADVIELIVHNRLNSSFARFLHKSLRATYRELVRRSRGAA